MSIAALRLARRAGWNGPGIPPMAGAGLFDGAISQMEGMFETNVKPMFSQLVGELQAIRSTDAHLDASVAALDQHLSALDQHIRALNQHMKALNAHPAVAAKAPAR